MIASAGVLDALEESLRERGVPVSRIALARRLTRALLDDAIVVHDDGTVYARTGDIDAMWLRDSTAQLRPLLALVPAIPKLGDLARGLLRTQVEDVLLDPRANAFNDGPTGAAMRRDFPDQSPQVFERKYAADSLCSPLTLAWLIWRATGSTSHVDERFLTAVRAIVEIWRSEQNHDCAYRFQRLLGRRRGSLSNKGLGAPVGPTGMTWSGFRPSDDACVYGYHVPANALVAVSLERVAGLADTVAQSELALEARSLAAEVRAGIMRHGLASTPDGPIYAYEADGLGRQLLLDDANIPSLLSFPYLGFCDRSDPIYRRTRVWALGPANPCWASGSIVSGIGSIHTRRGWVWPLALAMEGLTGDGDEPETALRMIEKITGNRKSVGESIHPSRPRRFTRSWFSWADMLYVELVLTSAGLVS